MAINNSFSKINDFFPRFLRSLKLLKTGSYHKSYSTYNRINPITFPFNPSLISIPSLQPKSIKGSLFTPYRITLFSFTTFSHNSTLPNEPQNIVHRCETLTSQILSTSLENYWNLVTDLPFWEAELERISQEINPYLHHPLVSNKFNYLSRLINLIYQIEDVRDALNEISEQSSRSSGIAGVGLFAHEKVENISEHAEAAVKKYNELLNEYREFQPQINETIGKALAILRQKQKYDWSSMHSFFY